MRYIKIPSIVVFGLLILFAFLTVGKLVKIDVSPDALLLAEEKVPVNRVEPALSGNEKVTITFDENTSYIIAVQKKGDGEEKYELITPSKVYDKKDVPDDKTLGKVQELFLQIVSGSGNANAVCGPKCSGTLLPDGSGYVSKQCWWACW